MSEEVGAKFCPKIVLVLPNYAPKIRSMHERFRRDTRYFLKAPKRHLSLYANAFIFNQQTLNNNFHLTILFILSRKNLQSFSNDLPPIYYHAQLYISTTTVELWIYHNLYFYKLSQINSDNTDNNDPDVD